MSNHCRIDSGVFMQSSCARDVHTTKESEEEAEKENDDQREDHILGGRRRSGDGVDESIERSGALGL